MLEGYEKLKTVGKGSFGTATLYRRLDDGKHVVMKEIFTMDMDDNAKHSAMNEVEIISTLSHPNIVRYLGNFQKLDSLIIIMEYADGGNLTQLINLKRNKNDVFTEKGILNIASQVCTAIAYMHSCKILHRDLKTANIFLTANGTIKVGDFGISKVLTTKSQAETVVGTPYYLSPEICEGHPYNEKSDIWAIGCITYELACLKKPFEAPTLPLLVHKITVCEYENIPNMYSEDLHNMVNVILQKKSSNRPSASNLYKTIIPNIVGKQKNISDLNSTGSTIFSDSIPKKRSVLYEMHNFGKPEIEVIEMPHKKIIDISASISHNILVTSDNLVFAWGNNTFGQLGLSNVEIYRKKPICINYLSDKHIIRASAGDGFSIFLSYYGYIFACGDGTNGCLGNGNLNGTFTPTILNTLTTMKISNIVCGTHHVAALSRDGKLYTWGTSTMGALGQGHREISTKPTSIILPVKIKQVYCSHDATLIYTCNEEILVCGNNNFYKLGLTTDGIISTFRPVNFHCGKIRDISMGYDHTIILMENGELIGMGSNKEYQFGKINVVYNKNSRIIALNKKINLTSCGPSFTSAVDTENVIWIWGRVKTLKEEVNTNTCVKIPKSILALYSSKKNLKNSNFLKIGIVKAKENSLLVVVHTTTPAASNTGEDFNIATNNFVSNSSKFSQLPTDLPNTPR